MNPIPSANWRIRVLCCAVAFSCLSSGAGRTAPAETATRKTKNSVSSATNVDDEQLRFLEASRREHSPPYDWKVVSSWNFDNTAALANLRVIDGQWEISKSQLKAASGKAMSSRTILISPILDGPQRIEFDATLLPRPDGRVGDICVRLNADPQTGSFARGYALIAAQYFNQAAVCYRLNIPISRTEGPTVTPGKRHHVVVEWKPPEGHLRFFVDNRIILDTWDRTSPLSPDPTRWFGLSTYDTQMVVDNLTISTGTPIPRTRPVKEPQAKTETSNKTALQQ